MLTDHRRAFWYSLALLGCLILVVVAVGRHPASAAPQTTFPFVGRSDQRIYDAMHTLRATPLTWFFRFLNVAGGGIVTIPLRAIVSLFLLVRRRWRRAGAFLLTSVASELLLTLLKAWFHRGRPPGTLVAVAGYSFPSGHATAGAATAVALVLALMSPGAKRRKWEFLAIGFAFVMAFSRVYLHAHWFSDVVAGVLLGSGIALGSAALATEVATIGLRRQAAQPAETADG